MQKQEEGPAPSVFFEESDRSAFGEVGDISALLDESFPDGAIIEATPTGAGAQGLRLAGPDELQGMVSNGFSVSERLGGGCHHANLAEGSASTKQFYSNNIGIFELGRIAARAAPWT